MKRLLTVLMAGLLILAITAPALAWEFEMSGEFEYRLRYFGRTGIDDLFGTGGNVGFAGPNIYGNTLSIAAAAPDSTNAGMAIRQGGFDLWGSDAFQNDQRITLVPTIRVNNAIRVHGVYTIGGYRNIFAQHVGGQGIPPFERYSMNNVPAGGAYTTVGIGSWEQVRATIQLPIGVLSIGSKDFPFGLGTMFARNTRSDSFLLVLPWGPFRFLPAFVALSRNIAGNTWDTRPEGGFKNDGYPGFLFTYNQANLDWGAGTWYLYAHRDAQYNTLTAAQAATFGLAAGARAGADLTNWIMAAYFKYNNGRFFLNGEYIQLNTEVHHSGFQTVGGAAAAPLWATERYTEQTHAFAEGGFLCGPAKLSLMWAWSPGFQLRGAVAGAGAYGAGTPNPTKIRSILDINYQAMEPYNYLMFYTYGGGNNRFNADGTGQMGDANAYAARFDYAVASNLNVWGSYIWAERLEKDGYYAGQFTATGAVVPALGEVAFGPSGANVFVATNGGTDPFAGNGFLGWELDVGLDWKLLEGMTTNLRYAYWAPGDWFTRGYQYHTRNNGAVGANPDHVTMKDGRSPINALHWSILVNF